MYEIIARFEESESAQIMGEYVGELVRCGECKYAKEWGINSFKCKLNPDELHSIHTRVWFCADGKRRTDT